MYKTTKSESSNFFLNSKKAFHSKLTETQLHQRWGGVKATFTQLLASRWPLTSTPCPSNGWMWSKTKKTLSSTPSCCFWSHSCVQHEISLPQSQHLLSPLGCIFVCFCQYECVCKDLCVCICGPEGSSVSAALFLPSSTTQNAKAHERMED